MNPYQARVCTMDEAVKQLTALVPTGSNWPYILVQLNGDTHHVPLPREGHLSALVEGTSSATCGQISHLEVCQLLSSNSPVIYPVGLNGYEVSVVVSPPESLAKGTNLLGGKPIYLKWTSHSPPWRGENPKCHPLAVTPPPSKCQVPSGLLCQRQKERSA